MTNQYRIRSRRLVYWSVFNLLMAAALLGTITHTFAQSNPGFSESIVVPIREKGAYGVGVDYITSPGDIPLTVQVAAYGETDNAEELIGAGQIGGTLVKVTIRKDNGKFLITPDFSPLKATKMAVGVRADSDVVNFNDGLDPMLEMVAVPNDPMMEMPEVQFIWGGDGPSMEITITFPDYLEIQPNTAARSGKQAMGNKLVFRAASEGVTVGDFTAVELLATDTIKLIDYNVLSEQELTGNIIPASNLKVDLTDGEQIIGLTALTEPITQALKAGEFSVRSYGTVDGISNQHVSGYSAAVNDDHTRMEFLPDVGDLLNPYERVGIMVLDDGVVVEGDGVSHDGSRARNPSEYMMAHGYRGWLTCIYFTEPVGIIDTIMPEYQTSIFENIFSFSEDITASAFGLDSGLINLDPISLKFEGDMKFELTDPDEPSEFVTGDQIIIFPFSKDAPKHDQLTGLQVQSEGFETELSDLNTTTSEPTSFERLPLEMYNEHVEELNGDLDVRPHDAAQPFGVSVDVGKTNAVLQEMELFPGDAGSSLQAAVELSEIELARINWETLVGDRLRLSAECPFCADQGLTEPLTATFRLDGDIVLQRIVKEGEQPPEIILGCTKHAVHAVPFEISENGISQSVSWREVLCPENIVDNNNVEFNSVTWEYPGDGLTNWLSELAYTVRADGFEGFKMTDLVLDNVEYDGRTVKPGENTRPISDKALSFAPLKPAEFFKAAIELNDNIDYASLRVLAQQADVQVTVPVTQAVQIGKYDIAAFDANQQLLNRVVFEPNDANNTLQLVNQAANGINTPHSVHLKLNGDTVMLLTEPITAAVSLPGFGTFFDVTPYRFNQDTNRVESFVTVPVTAAVKATVETQLPTMMRSAATAQMTEVLVDEIVFVLDTGTAESVASVELSGEDLAELSVLNINEVSSVPLAVQLGGSAIQSAHTIAFGALFMLILLGATAVIRRRG